MSLKPCSAPLSISIALSWPHRLVLADLLDELLEAVLAKLLRNGVRREGDGVGFVGAVELHLAGRRVVAPEREVDGLHGRRLVRRTRLREETLLDADAPKSGARRGGCEATAKPTARACARTR